MTDSGAPQPGQESRSPRGEIPTHVISLRAEREAAPDQISTVAVLAMLVDASIAAVQWALRRRPSAGMRSWPGRLTRAAALGAPLLLLGLGVAAAWMPGRPGPTRNADRPDAVVRVGAGAFTGSGSVITDDVPADALALARGRQVAKDGWAADFRARKRAAKAAKKADEKA